MSVSAPGFCFRSSVALAVLWGSSLAVTAHAGDVIQVPLRWCAIDGSPAVANPGGAPPNPYNGMPEPDTDSVLWRRHERATDKIMVPGAEISYRSAITAAIRDDASFPIIPDPCPPVTQPLCQGGSTDGFSCTPDGMGGAPECDAGVSCATQMCPASCPVGCSGALGDVFRPRNACQSGAQLGVACTPDMAGQDAGVCGAGVACSFEITEFNLAIASCTSAWDGLTGSDSTADLGQVAVNARVFVRSDGTRDTLKGRAQGSSITLSGGGDICAIPPSGVLGATGGAMVAIDNQMYTAGDIPFEQVNERLTAHELGHTLFLWHGDGIDNDMDGGYDQVCDPGGDESACASPTTMMSSSSCGMLSTSMTTNQRDTARSVASVYTGAMMDPPGVLIAGPNQGDQRSDPPLDVGDRAIDLLWVAVHENADAGRTSLTHRVFGALPPVFGQVRRYAVFADLDDDPGTGGAPADLGFDTAFLGAELVASVRVEWAGQEFPRFVAVAEIWRDSGNGLQLCDRATECESVRARVLPIVGGDDDPGDDGGSDLRIDAHSIVIDMPNAVRGGMGERVRIQALSERMDDPEHDRLPDDEAEGSVFIPVAPEFPACLVTPAMVEPGQMAQVEADPLRPGEMAKIFVGDLAAGGGLIGEDGVARLDFRVPIEAQPGTRLVTVGVAGTALTADCTVDVVPGPPVRLAPVVASNLPGGTHELLASVFENGEPVPGVLVDLSVVSGPNAGAAVVCDPADCTSDEFGRVRFRYTGSGATGADELQAVAMTGGMSQPSNGAISFWDGDCNANAVADTCDVSCGGFSGLCGEVLTCGASSDADANGQPDECNQAPVCNAAQSAPRVLRRADGRLHPISILGVTDPDGDDVKLTVRAIAQDEPVKGKGWLKKAAPDGLGVGLSKAFVRAERSPLGRGRVYHIDFEASDPLGGTCSETVQVCVPIVPWWPYCHDRGPLFDSTQKQH